LLRSFFLSATVTCIQFNPVDDRYFISGSLDAKVRIWSIPDRKVVDWTDLHEMVTAACYTPDGQVGLRLIWIFLNTQKYHFMFNWVKLSGSGCTGWFIQG